MTMPRRLLALSALSGLLLSGASAAAFAQSNDPSFRVNNLTAVTVNELYVSSSRDDSWGRDHLGQNVLPSGQSVIVRLPVGQCVNDIRVVYANGRAAEQRQVNTCNLTDYNLN